MTKRLLLFSGFILASIFSSSSFAGTCLDDVAQMKDEIKEWGSITILEIVNGNYIRTEIEPIVEKETKQIDQTYCQSAGFSVDGLLFFRWKLGDWGDTLKEVKNPDV